MGEEEGGEQVLERTEGLMKKDGRNAVNVESFEIPESGALVDLQLKTKHSTLCHMFLDATLAKTVKMAKYIWV